MFAPGSLHLGLRAIVLVTVLFASPASRLRRQTQAVHSDVLFDLTQSTLPEVMSFSDGYLSDRRQIEISTNRFYDISSMAQVKDRSAVALSHITFKNENQWVENELRTTVSTVHFSCMCATPRCTIAVAADLDGVTDRSQGDYRASGPLFLTDPNGQLLPCLLFQGPIDVNGADVENCKLKQGKGPWGELLLEDCDGGGIESVRFVHANNGSSYARPMTPWELMAPNVIPEFLPDPTVSIGEVLAETDGPIVANVAGQNVNLRNAAEVLMKSTIDQILRALWPTEFDESRPGSQIPLHALMRIPMKFAYFGYLQSRHGNFTKQESHQLDGVGQYNAVKSDRPPAVQAAGIVNNIVVLLAAAIAWAVTTAKLIKESRITTRSASSMENLRAAVAASTVTFSGALYVFVVQWKAMNERINYSGSMLIIEVLGFSRMAGFFPGSVGQTSDLRSVSVSSVELKDVSADLTWLFVLGVLLTVTAVAVGFHLGWKEQQEDPGIDEADEKNEHQPIWFKKTTLVAFIWLASVITITVIVAMTTKDNNGGLPQPVFNSLGTPPAPSDSAAPGAPEVTPDTAPSQTPAMAPTPPPTLTPGNQGVTCKNCCDGGGGACRHNRGTIGDNSCNAYGACRDNEGDIGPNSCNDSSSCRSNTGAIMRDSCSGYAACNDNEGQIGPNSCNDSSACGNNIGVIMSGSCSGYSACSDNTRTIGSGICNGSHACDGNR